MEAIAQQFLNLAIMERALPLLLMGLRQTAILCPVSYTHLTLPTKA